MSLILFQPTSPANDSVVFELTQQKTVVAMGMQPDDYITFEIVLISDAARARICGCRLLESGLSSVYQLQPLMCPACSDGSPRFVRVTPQNPIVVLDAPQGALLRAVYHGTGVDLKTVTVTVADSDTIDLTSTLRGCPPVYCEDEPETWTPTGLHRCTSTNVEIEEISNCGNKRWVECGPVVWTDTGTRRCLAGSYSMQEQNQCGALRWTIIEAVAWIDTGASNCFDDAGTIRVRYEQTNQCGARRWETRGEPTWTATGNFQCVNGFVHVEERSEPCGLLRTNTQGNTVPVTWTATGATRCTASAFERAETDQCGNTRWVYQAPLTWTPTGVYNCVGGINQRQESNQCGTIRWVNTGEACGTSTHTMTSLTSAAASVVEGQTACWNFTLNAAVVGAPLTIQFDVSGADHVRNGYATPRSVTLAVGASSGQVCIATTDDVVIDGTEQLCVTPVLSARLTNAPGVSCINVLDNDVPGAEPEDPYSLVFAQTTPDPVTEGQQVCWSVTASRPIENTPLVVGVVWGGADDTRNNYPNGSFSIAVGQTVGTLCQVTTDDLDVDGTEQLCIASLVPNGRISGSPVLPCVDVLDNDTLPPGDSTHTILSIVPVTTPITEGQQACWLVTLDTPVANSNLAISFNLSGADQTRHGYAAPSLSIPVGQSSGTVCVTSIDDVVIDGMEQLCIAAITSARVTAVPAASCINVNDNDVAASIHTISCVTPPAQAVEGALVCWYFELDAPVAVTPLTVTGTLSGTEQDIHGYANPSVVVPVGQSSGQLCVQTIDDALVEGMRTLCLTFATSARVTSISDTPCGGSQASLIFTNVSGIDQTINEGQTLNVRVALSTAAPAGGVSGTISFSGSEYTANPGAYPVVNYTVPEGATFVDTGVVVFDDAFIDGPSALYGTLAVATSGWVVGIANAGATVVNNDFGDGGGGGGVDGGGGCFLSGTKLRTPTGYVNINSLLPEDELLAFALPGMPGDSNPDWTAWSAPTLAGLSYLATRVVSNTVFTEDKVVVVNGELNTTEDHRYFVSNGERFGWVQAKDLNNRYALVTSTGTVAVETVEIHEGGYTFFSLDVEAPDTLIAKTSFGDVLAHNRKCADCPGAPGPTGLL